MSKLVADSLEQALEWWPKIDIGKAKNWTDVRFNQLICIYRTESTCGVTKWVCQCDCGKYISCFLPDLKNNITKSCPCNYNRSADKINYRKDLTNQQFGNLICLKPTKEKSVNRNIIWKCQCQCKNKTIVYASVDELTSGKKVSCGCLKVSKGELKIKEILKELNISFEEQKTFEDCIFINNLYFDFYLPDYNLLIEYDGEQHFKPIEFFGGKQKFEEQQKRDNFKNNYCLINNIRLIRIPYSDYQKITKEYIENILFI